MGCISLRRGVGTLTKVPFVLARRMIGSSAGGIIVLLPIIGLSDRGEPQVKLVEYSR